MIVAAVGSLGCSLSKLGAGDAQQWYSDSLGTLGCRVKTGFPVHTIPNVTSQPISDGHFQVLTHCTLG